MSCRGRSGRHRPASRRSCRGCSNWAGPTAATCGSTIAGAAGDADRIRQTRGGIGRARAGRRPGFRHLGVGPLLQATRTVPIVFAQVADPVGAGFVDSLARPAAMPPDLPHSNTASSGEMAGGAQTDRAERDARGGPSRPCRTPPESASSPRSSLVAPRSAWKSARSTCAPPAEIERDIAAFARGPTGGLIVTASALAIDASRADRHACARHKLPAVYLPSLLRHRRRLDILRT